MGEPWLPYVIMIFRLRVPLRSNMAIRESNQNHTQGPTISPYFKTIILSNMKNKERETYNRATM